jgi:predicted transcriptional regulator
MIQDNVLAAELQMFRFRNKVSQLAFAMQADVTQSVISTFEKHGIASETSIAKIRTTLKKERVKG